MAAILAVTFPFFALVLCGYLAARSRLLPLDAVPGLNMFVLYFALPCMLWRFGSSTPPWQLFNPAIALLWLAAGALIVAGTAWLARRRGADWPDAAMGALVAAFPNSGFMGVPLILALLGEGAVGPVMATLLVDLVVTTSLCIGLSQWGSAGEHGPARAVGRALQGVLRNPMPWSILLGALAGALPPRHPRGQRDDQRRAGQPQQRHDRVEQLQQRRRAAKPVEHARQREIQHEHVQARHRVQRLQGLCVFVLASFMDRVLVYV